MSLGFDPLLQSLVEVAQRSLGFELFRDVCIGAEPPDNFPGFVAYWLSAREEPAEIAVTTAQREGVLPRLVVLEAFSDVPGNAFEMIGMVQFLPAKALYLIERGSGIVIPSLVVPIPLAFRVGRPGKLAHVVGELAEARLAFAQCMLAGGGQGFGSLEIGYRVRNAVTCNVLRTGRLLGWS